MKIILSITSFCLALFIISSMLYLSSPTQEDINSCMKSTNYTLEQCKFELNR